MPRYRFIIAEEFREEEGKDYVDAFFTDEEIEEMKKRYPEIRWNDESTVKRY